MTCRCPTSPTSRPAAFMSLVRTCVQGTMWTSFWWSGSSAEASPGVSGYAYGHHMCGGKVSVSELQHPFPVSTSTWFPFCNSKPQRKMFAWKRLRNRRFFWSIENGSCDQPNPKRSTAKWCYSTLFNNWCLSTQTTTQPWRFFCKWSFWSHPCWYLLFNLL